MINNFRGKYYFLSNYYLAPVTYDGITYNNSEAAFQAQKTTDINERLKFSKMTSPEARKAGRRVVLREDWEQIKYNTMYEICKAKFEQNPSLLKRLIDTGDEELIEGNTWHDTCWGVYKGVGENNLGKILMKIRSEIKVH